jgi:hypothetical protein
LSGGVIAMIAAGLALQIKPNLREGPPSSASPQVASA